MTYSASIRKTLPVLPTHNYLPILIKLLLRYLVTNQKVSVLQLATLAARAAAVTAPRSLLSYGENATHPFEIQIQGDHRRSILDSESDYGVFYLPVNLCCDPTRVECVSVEKHRTT